MSKVMIAYISLSGNTEKMAQYITEGTRFSGQEAVIETGEGMRSCQDYGRAFGEKLGD